KFVNELETKLEVIEPATNKVTQTIPMDQTAAGRYTADFKIQKYGSYLLKAVHQRAGKTVAESLGSVALSYPLEYLRIRGRGLSRCAARDPARPVRGVARARPRAVADAALRHGAAGV